MMRYNHARSPALMPQEAAMLPAQTEARPAWLLRQRREEDFVSVPEMDAAANQPRRGSAAGRAILRSAGISMPGVGPMSRGW